MAKKIPGVPAQSSGSYHDTVICKKFENINDVESKFNHVEQKFYDVNSWTDYASAIPYYFRLLDAFGNEVKRNPQVGDYIKIAADKNDVNKKDVFWIRIDMMDASMPDQLIMQVRPSKAPGQEFSGKIKHYLSSCSSTSFIITKGEDFVEMGIYSRNEKPNFNASLVTRIKNIFTCIKSKMGKSKIAWQNLADGLMLSA